MILHKPDRKMLAERLLVLRRARTNSLDTSQRWLIWRRRVARAGKIVGIVLILLAFAGLCAWSGLLAH